MFVITYERKNGCFEYDADVSECSIPSDLIISNDRKQFIVGCCADISPEELFKSDWENRPAVLNDYCSALYVVKHDESGCTFAADTTGRELLFYYHSEDKLVLSDSFWGICKIVKPSFFDIDWDIVEEMIASGGGVPCDNNLLIKGLKWLAPNTLCRFDAATGSFKSELFGEVRRTSEICNIHEAVESFDESMKQMAAFLVSKHENETFGLGLSGGLDSRVAFHYLSEAGIDPVCFNVCVKRPHKVFLAQSVIQAKRLADIAKVNLQLVEWNPATIIAKNLQLLRAQPFGTCGHFNNAYKYEDSNYPQINVLISAGQAIGPALVGVSVYSNMDSLAREDVVQYLIELCTADIWPYGPTRESARRGLHMLGYRGPLPGGHNAKTWKSIATSAAYERISQRVRDFVDKRLEKDFRPSDITLDYRTSALGAIGRNGAYESALGTQHSYTIYTPFLVKEGLSWDSSLVEDRKVLKELIKKKIPEFSTIGEENAGSLDENQSKARLFLEKAQFVIRGTGIYAGEWYSNHPAVREAYLSDMTNGCGWFYEVFPAAREYEKVWGMSFSRRCGVWELKRIIDCIETQAYLSEGDDWCNTLNHTRHLVEGLKS